MRKDSLHMDDQDRALIREAIERQPHRHVLVTHATDTMVETAPALGSTARFAITPGIRHLFNAEGAAITDHGEGNA